MPHSDSLFIAIEGLDGSGKTTLAKQLAKFLGQALECPVQFTYQPHDESCGGDYIRQVLKKEITHFTEEALLYGFAANRQDHGARVINPILDDKGGIVICDRYYLSSLVYQSSEKYPLDYVMMINQTARQPDLTIFMNVDNQTVYERMKVRNKPPELFEKDLSATRQKYQKGITFLRATRQENIVEIDASGTMEVVLTLLVGAVMAERPAWTSILEDHLEEFRIEVS